MSVRETDESKKIQFEFRLRIKGQDIQKTIKMFKIYELRKLGSG